MQQRKTTSLLFAQHPEIRLLVAVLIFAGVLIFRMPNRTAPIAFDAAAPAPVELSAKSVIDQLQERIKQHPEDTDAYAQLGLALLQQVRETGDPLLYAQAEQAFAAALKRDAQQPDALIGQGLLALSRHQFRDALRWGEQARAAVPNRAQVYGIIGDAQIELGRYKDAVTTIQRMVDTRPDLPSYSRVSYLRELHGDTPGAIAAMRQAIEAGNPNAEHTRWSQVQLGQLYFNSGDLVQAERTYAEVLYTQPDYVYALAGIARIRAAQGKRDEAIALYKEIVERLPLPEFIIALGDLYEAGDRPQEAKAQYDLVRVIQQLHANAGVDVDLELIVFEIDHGADPEAIARRARASYQRRPSIYAADALAWALYRQGKYAEAQRYSEEALRLGTCDATLHYHAGVIADALGNRLKAADHLRQALAINPFFSIRSAQQARALLSKLSSPSFEGLPR